MVPTIALYLSILCLNVDHAPGDKAPQKESEEGQRPAERPALPGL